MSKKIKRKEVNNFIKLNQVSEKINFDFCFFKFKSVKFGNFTNYVKDKKESTEIINKLFKEFNPNMTTKDIAKRDHFHEIIELEKIKLISKILEKLEIDQLDEKESYYQIAFTQGLRIMCIKIHNTIYPLFLDPHHLIYPDDKYNSRDSKKFNCCIFDR